MSAVLSFAESTPSLDVAALASLRFFQGVELAPIAPALAGCEVRELAARQVLLVPNQANKSLYVVLAGTLNVHLGAIDSEPVAQLTAGDSVGELSLVDHQPACAFVVAAEATRVLVIDEPTFWLLIDSSHGLSRNLLFTLAQRLRRNNIALSAGIRLQDQYKREGSSDGLTGLNNRRWLDAALPAEIARCIRDGKALSVVMVDVDHFKRFNDRHGHLNGDVVLRAVAQTMVDNVRPSDMLARFGGEEFIALLPSTPVQGATLVAERLRKAVADSVVLARDGTPLPSVTVSLGIAAWRVPQDGPALIAAADAALYRAKRQGRNRVCCDNAG